MTTPLPLAANRAALSNQISLLISNRTSLLKTLCPESSHRRAQPSNSTHRHKTEDDEDLWKANRPNEGVGYVSEKPTADSSREEKILRSKLLGKRKHAAGASTSKLPESESDEEEGRGSLGKRKRPRRGKAPPSDEDSEVAAKAVGETATAPNEPTPDVHMIEVEAEAATATTIKEEPQKSKQKKKKRKKKSKGKGQETV